MVETRWLQDKRPGRSHILHRWNEIQAENENLMEISPEVAANILAAEGVDISDEILASQQEAADNAALDEQTGRIRAKIAKNRAAAAGVPDAADITADEPVLMETGGTFEDPVVPKPRPKKPEPTATPEPNASKAEDGDPAPTDPVVQEGDKATGLKIGGVGAVEKPEPLPLAAPVDIIAAVNRLSRTDNAHWVGGGLPRVDSVLAELGEGVSVTRPAITAATGGATRESLSANEDASADTGAASVKSDTPAETPADTPAETPADVPAETPADVPADADANDGFEG